MGTDHGASGEDTRRSALAVELALVGQKQRVATPSGRRVFLGLPWPPGSGPGKTPRALLNTTPFANDFQTTSLYDGTGMAERQRFTSVWLVAGQQVDAAQDRNAPPSARHVDIGPFLAHELGPPALMTNRLEVRIGTQPGGELPDGGSGLATAWRMIQRQLSRRPRIFRVEIEPTVRFSPLCPRWRSITVAFRPRAEARDKAVVHLAPGPDRLQLDDLPSIASSAATEKAVAVLRQRRR